MTLPNPKFAPRRGDLPWLRRRRKPPAPKVAETPAATKAAPVKTAPVKAAPVTPAPPRRPPAPAPAAASGPKIDYTRHDRSTPPPAPRPAVAAHDNPLDLSLDLSSPPAPVPPSAPAPPSTPPARPPAPSSAGTSLDLDLSGPPAPTPPSTPASSTSLDLGGGSDASPPTRAGGRQRAAVPPPPTDRHHVTRRTRRGVTTLLEFPKPVVTLDRVQSGVGQFTVDAVVGDEVGDLRIGAAWALADGRSGTVELAADRRNGPDGRRPVVWAVREGRFERIAVDLRQARSLQRLLVYAFSPTRSPLTWGGTVVMTTFGGDRIDAPIQSPPSPAVLALVSVYNVDGEFVVRSEMDPVAGSVRDTCRAFGFDRITWLDDRTPVS